MRWLQYSQTAEWPPFPSVPVLITDLLGERGVGVQAKIDTGAFMTIVPYRVVEYLRADCTTKSIRCWGYDGHCSNLSGFLVNVYIDHPHWPSEAVRAFEGIDVLAVNVDGAADTDAPTPALEMLLGRDILAAWNLHLDGPKSRYSVT